MQSTARRRTAAAALVLLAPALGACGFGYQTDQVYQPAVGTNDQSGEVDVLGGVVVSSSKGSGTFIASLVNKSPSNPDQLVSVTSDDGEVTLSAPIELPAGQLVNLADAGAVRFDGEQVDAGNFVHVTLEFGNGQKSEMDVPVVPKEGTYADVKSAPSSSTPSASPSSSPSPSPSATP